MGNTGKGKFKVGDVVRKSDQSYSAIATICAVSGTDEGLRYSLKWTSGQITNRWTEKELELVSPTTPAIVAVIENGTPKPNARPRIHDTEASATTEAERLAKLNPGQTFGVFVQTTARVADVTVRVA